MLFGTTLVVTLATNLSIGVAAGVVLKMTFYLTRGPSLGSLFKTSREQRQNRDELTFPVHGVAAFTNVPGLRRCLSSVDESVPRVVIHPTEVTLVDHTFLSRVEAIADEWPNTMLKVAEVDGFATASGHPHISRRKAR